MRQPLVSVIIPFYKGKEWLNEAIKSVFEQTYDNYEVLLINDGSEEDISDIVRRWEGVVRYYYQTNRGAAAARNLGIMNARGDYIAFLDSDDLWLPKKLEIQISRMLENNAMWSHTSYLKFDNNGIINKIDVSAYKGNIFPISIISNPIATPSVIVNKKVFEKNINIKFEEEMKYGEDTIMWMLLSMKYELYVIEEAMVKVRIRGTNSSMLTSSQISGRSSLWLWIESNKPFNVKQTFRFHTRIAYKYCVLLNSFINNKKFFHNKEIVLLLMFFFPWLIFKFDKLIFYYKTGR